LRERSEARKILLELVLISEHAASLDGGSAAALAESTSGSYA
jgi:hypothetical protein